MGVGFTDHEDNDFLRVSKALDEYLWTAVKSFENEHGSIMVGQVALVLSTMLGDLIVNELPPEHRLELADISHARVMKIIKAAAN